MLPGAVILEQNYPNPFNPETTIRYQLATESQVRLSLINITGQEAAVPVNEQQSAGMHHYAFSTARTPLPSGLYFYRLQLADPASGAGAAVSLSKKMLIIKRVKMIEERIKVRPPSVRSGFSRPDWSCFFLIVPGSLWLEKRGGWRQAGSPARPA